MYSCTQALCPFHKPRTAMPPLCLCLLLPAVCSALSWDEEELLVAADAGDVMKARMVRRIRESMWREIHQCMLLKQ
jgi:hypothetical protein